MADAGDRFEVRERAGQSRYVLLDHQAADPGDRVVGEEAYVDVPTETDAGPGVQRILFHTGVSDAYAGRGLASLLVEAVVVDVIARGYRIVPVCPYVATWLPKHPEYSEHVVKPTPAHLRAVAAHRS